MSGDTHKELARDWQLWVAYVAPGSGGTREEWGRLRNSRGLLWSLVARGYRPSRVDGMPVLMGPDRAFFYAAPFGGAVAMSYASWLVGQIQGEGPR